MRTTGAHPVTVCVTSFLLVCLLRPVAAAAPSDDDLAREAISILHAQCTDCHDDSARSGLDVTTRELLLKGGKRGPSLVPGDAKKSLLYRLVAHAEKPAMPPGDARLKPAEIATLRRWIDAGAPWPKAGKREPVAAAKWWSFTRPVRPTPPAQGGDPWVRTPVDAFILEKLREKELRPAPESDRYTFIRRATFDLHGLPPTADEARAFLEDRSADAYEKLVDRLLASPRYGERWARHWLDLVRYADSSGFEQDPYLLDAWRFRDWVVKSLNDDKPYDRFVQEQLAGDELWPEDEVARAGTGFFTVGPNRDMLFKVEDINRIESLTDFVDTTGSAFLGLSVACARCHDHKFEPISQKDYYRLWAVFVPLVKTRVFLHYNDARAWDIGENIRTFKLRDIGEDLSALFGPYRRRLGEVKRARLPAEVRTALETPDARRTPEQKALAEANGKAVQVSDDEVRAALSKDDARKLAAIERRLVSMYANYRVPPWAPGVTEMGPVSPEETFVPRRGGGNGEKVIPGFLSALGGGDIPPPPPTATSTGRRKALALWLASADNPLFARVMVNRVWHYHFGRGLVATPSDFGRRGAPPSHPQLLDWLATELAAQGWSLKKLHRTIMLSSVYRTVAVATPEAHKLDPENVLLSHFNRRRLSSEEIRDAVLQAAGTLNLKMGGRPVVPPLLEEELFGISMHPRDSWPVTGNAAEHTRRSLYLLYRRGYRQPLFEAFDTPDGVLHAPRRESSTTAPQSLTLLNSGFTYEQAQAFARAVELQVAKAGARDDARVADAAFRQALARAPAPEEAALARRLLVRQTKLLGGRTAAVAELGRALFNLNEFLYVD